MEKIMAAPIQGKKKNVNTVVVKPLEEPAIVESAIVEEPVSIENEVTPTSNNIDPVVIVDQPKKYKILKSKVFSHKGQIISWKEGDTRHLTKEMHEKTLAAGVELEEVK